MINRSRIELAQFLSRNCPCRGTSKIFGRFARAFYPFFIPAPLFPSAPRPPRSLHRLVKRQKKTRGRRVGQMEEKECPKKGVLGRGHQKLFHGGDPAAIHPCPQRTLSFPLLLFLFLSFSLSSLPAPSLYFCSSSFRLPCLAKTRRLSLKVTRRNRRRVTRACKRVEGERGGEESSGWWDAGNHEADGARTLRAILWILPKIP